MNEAPALRVCGLMIDRTAEFEAAIRAQASLISEAQELLTRYLSKRHQGRRRLWIASYGSWTGRNNARRGRLAREDAWRKQSQAISLDLRENGCIVEILLAR